MKKLFCELVLDYYPRISEIEHLYGTSIANCFFNCFLSYAAIMLNIVTIHAITKTSSWPNSLKTLLLSLAISDVGVGLFVQPFYFSLLVKWIQHTVPNCNSYKTLSVIGILFATASFLGVVAVSVDRFLAIHLHLRYQELVTYKRVVAVVISIWVLSTFLTLTILWITPGIPSLILCVIIIIAVGLILTTMVYIRIYLAARRHKNQIQALQVQGGAEHGEMAHFAGLIKSAAGVFYVYLVFLVCYLPSVICLTAVAISGPSISLKRFFLFSWTFLFLNSSLNTVIYCWKMRHIRRAVMDILQNTPWFRNRGTR